MKRIASFFLALALAFSLTACTVPVEKADDGKIQIVATLFPYYDFARAIVGDRADVTLLLSPGREAHSFEPTPLDAVTISESDVFLYNGGEGEYWVDSMLGAAGENIAVIARMMDYVDALDEEYVEGMQGADPAMSMAATMTMMTMTTIMKRMSTTATRSNTTSTSGRRRKTPSSSAAPSATRSARPIPRTRTSTARTVMATARRSKHSTRALPLSAKARRTSSSSSPTASRCSTSAANSAWTTARRSTAARATPSPRSRPSSTSSTRWRMRSIPVVYTIDFGTKKVAAVVSECTGAAVDTLYSMQTVSRADFDAGETYLTLMERNYEALRKGLNE